MATEKVEAYRRAEADLFAAYGVEPQEHWVELPDHRTSIRVLEIGVGDPLLFIHGSPNNAATWIPLAAQMQDHRCLLMERPGAGLSGPVDRWRDHRTDSAAIVARVVDHFGYDVIDIAGSSFGGLYAYNFALAYPNRVRKLIQLGAPAGPSVLGLPKMFRFLSLPIPGALIGNEFRPSPEKAPGMFKSIGHGRSIAAGAIPTIVFEWYSTLLRNTSTGPNVLAEIKAIASPFGYRATGELSDSQIAGLKPQVLYLWGDDDSFATPAAADALCALTPGATIEHFEGFGHILWYDDPSIIAHRIRSFLAEGAPA